MTLIVMVVLGASSLLGLAVGVSGVWRDWPRALGIAALMIGVSLLFASMLILISAIVLR